MQKNTLTKPTANHLTNVATICYKKTQSYNKVSWLMTQSTGLTKKTYSLKKWLTDWNLSKTRKFYISSQIHKKNKPWRPVINWVNCNIANIQHFVDHHQQPLVREIPSCVKDTKISSTKLITFLFHLTH